MCLLLATTNGFADYSSSFVQILRVPNAIFLIKYYSLCSTIQYSTLQYCTVLRYHRIVECCCCCQTTRKSQPAGSLKNIDCMFYGSQKIRLKGLVQYSTVQYSTILFKAFQQVHAIFLFNRMKAQYSPVLYCTVLYYTILYCT